MSYLSIPMEIQKHRKVERKPFGKNTGETQNESLDAARSGANWRTPSVFCFLASLCFCFYLPEDPTRLARPTKSCEPKKHRRDGRAGARFLPARKISIKSDLMLFFLWNGAIGLNPMEHFPCFSYLPKARKGNIP
jgi:hypothetical protein